MSKKKLVIFFLVLCVIFFDFFRDYIFQNINFQLHYLSHFKHGNASTINMTDSTIEFFVEDLSRTTLIYLKWIFSGLFILIYLILTILLSKLIYKNQPSRLLISTAFFLSTISILFYVFCLKSKSVLMSNSFYGISIEISHFLQSSLFVISMLMIFKVYPLFKTAPNK